MSSTVSEHAELWRVSDAVDRETNLAVTLILLIPLCILTSRKWRQSDDSQEPPHACNGKSSVCCWMSLYSMSYMTAYKAKVWSCWLYRKVGAHTSISILVTISFSYLVPVLVLLWRLCNESDCPDASCFVSNRKFCIAATCINCAIFASILSALVVIPSADTAQQMRKILVTITQMDDGTYFFFGMVSSTVSEHVEDPTSRFME